jgi:hypothetical protein
MAYEGVDYGPLSDVPDFDFFVETAAVDLVSCGGEGDGTYWEFVLVY